MDIEKLSDRVTLYKRLEHGARTRGDTWAARKYALEVTFLTGVLRSSCQQCQAPVVNTTEGFCAICEAMGQNSADLEPCMTCGHPLDNDRAGDVCETCAYHECAPMLCSGVRR